MCFCCYSTKKKFVILIIIFCSFVTIFNVFSLIFRSTKTKEFELIKDLINYYSKNENLKKIKFSSLFKKFKKIEISFLIIIFSFSIFLLSLAIFLYLIIIKKLKNFLLIIKIFFIQILIEILLILVFLIIKVFVLKTSKNSLEKKFFSSTNKFENRLIINYYWIYFIDFRNYFNDFNNKNFNNDSNKNFNIVHQAFYHKNKIYIKINKNNQIVLVKIDENLIKPIKNKKNSNENVKKFEYQNKIYSIVNNNNNNENNNNENNNKNFVELKNTENNNNNKNKKNYKKYEIINNNSNQN